MTDVSTPKSAPPDWFGHPRGLFYLFFAEMWERFCFYGMRNILVLYMVSYFGYTKKLAQDGPYGAYTSMVYCSAILGGFIADKLLGYRRSIMFGGILMAAGMIMMLFNAEVLGFIGLSLTRSWEDFFFFTGLATIIVGNGYFKPNISTIVGKLYEPGDARRDRGFTIFYMGINLGALGGGIICAEIGQRISWPLGFGIAAAGMLLGVITFGSKGATAALMGHGEPKSEETSKRSFPMVILGSLVLIPAIYFLLNNNPWVFWLLVGSFAAMTAYLLYVAFAETKEQREKMFALMILVIFNISFWMLFEQAGSSLTLYADENLDRSFLGMVELSSGTVQNFNAAFIVLLAPLFAWLWMRTNRAGIEPSTPLKFVLGLVQLGIGFLILVVGARFFSPEGITPLWFMVGLYLLLTTGELCLSPVGLSMVTKLAPERMTGFVMGYWFLSIAGALNIAGWIGSLTATEEGAGAAAELTPTETISGYADVYMTGSYVIFGIAAFLLCLVPLLKKWMHDVN